MNSHEYQEYDDRVIVFQYNKILFTLYKQDGMGWGYWNAIMRGIRDHTYELANESNKEVVEEPPPLLKVSPKTKVFKVNDLWYYWDSKIDEAIGPFAKAKEAMAAMKSNK